MTDYDLCFDDILLTPRYSELSSRTTPDISTSIGGLTLKMPIISAAMDSITGKYMLVTMDKLGGLGILTRHINMPDAEELGVQMKEIAWAVDQGAQNIGCAIGIKGDTQEKAERLLDCGCNVICLDIAHGDHQLMYKAIDTLVELKNTYKFVVMAGNVCTGEAAMRFVNHGVDAIKAGIGPGGVCSTRDTTGFGRCQLSAIMECSEAIQDYVAQVSLIADGGIRKSGDMVKSLWSGADACMIGYMLAGTNATPRIGEKHIYRGMSSRAVSGRDDIAPEGVVIETGDRGNTETILLDCSNGIRSGLAMGGVNNLHELREKVEHTIVSPLSINESQPKTN